MDNQKLINRITLALLEIEKSEGVKVNFGFSQDYTGIRFDGSIQDRVSIERQDSLNLSACRRIGFTQNIIGASFDSPSTPGKFVISAIKPQNRKYPVIADNLLNGKSYKFSVAAIKKYLGGDKLINRLYNLEKLTQDDKQL